MMHQSDYECESRSSSTGSDSPYTEGIDTQQYVVPRTPKLRIAQARGKKLRRLRDMEGVLDEAILNNDANGYYPRPSTIDRKLIRQHYYSRTTVDDRGLQELEGEIKNDIERLTPVASHSQSSTGSHTASDLSTASSTSYQPTVINVDRFIASPDTQVDALWRSNAKHSNLGYGADTERETIIYLLDSSSDETLTGFKTEKDDTGLLPLLDLMILACPNEEYSPMRMNSPVFGDGLALGSSSRGSPEACTLTVYSEFNEAHTQNDLDKSKTHLLQSLTSKHSILCKGSDIVSAAMQDVSAVSTISHEKLPHDDMMEVTNDEAVEMKTQMETHYPENLSDFISGIFAWR